MGPEPAARVIIRQTVGGEFQDQGDGEWIVNRGLLRGHNGTPFGLPARGQPPAGLLADRGLATLRVYLAFSITIN